MQPSAWLVGSGDGVLTTRPPKGKVELEKPGVKYVYRKDAFRKVKIA